MTRTPRIHIVHGDHGWFARIVGANSRPIWQTEVYERRRDAARAVVIAVTAAATNATPGSGEPAVLIEDRDERTTR